MFQIRQTYMDNHPLVGTVTRIHTPEMKMVPTMNLSDAKVMAQMKNIIFSDIFQDGGHRFEEMFRLCYWNRKKLNCSHSFSKVFTDGHGLCYVFNHDGKFNTHHTGDLYGLEIVIDIQQFLYSHMSTSAGAGVKVVVHEAGSFPMFEEKAHLISPGMASELMIFRKKVLYFLHCSHFSFLVTLILFRSGSRCQKLQF